MKKEPSSPSAASAASTQLYPAELAGAVTPNRKALSPGPPKVSPVKESPVKAAPTATKRGMRRPSPRSHSVAASPFRTAIGKRARRRQKELDEDLVSSDEDEEEMLDVSEAVDAVGFTAEAAALSAVADRDL